MVNAPAPRRSGEKRIRNDVPGQLRQFGIEKRRSLLEVGGKIGFLRLRGGVRRVGDIAKIKIGVVSLERLQDFFVQRDRALRRNRHVSAHCLQSSQSGLESLALRFLGRKNPVECQVILSRAVRKWIRLRLGDRRLRQKNGQREDAHKPSTGYPARTQASNPPASGLTNVNPRSISMRATRAAEASFGHVQ